MRGALWVAVYGVLGFGDVGSLRYGIVVEG